MAGMGKVIAFVAVTDLDRAEHFYGSILGLPLHDDRPFALSCDVAGTRLRITLVESITPPAHTVAGWTVEDIDTSVEELTARGIRFTRYNGMDQDRRGIWTSPRGARVAWFLDPDGNNLSITQDADE